MAKLFNSNQPKWLYFCNEEDTTKRQQFAVAVGSNPEHIQIKSQSQGFVYVQFHEAGHDGTLPAIGGRESILVTLGCANGNEAFIIETLMKWICDAGTDEISASNQRFLEFTGKDATISQVPDMLKGFVTYVKVDFDTTD